KGPHFSFGGEVREWPGRDINWFRTFVADVNVSYRAIETLKIPTVAVVQGIAFGGGFELALACDFLVAADNAVFRCVEVTTAMLPIAGALQRIAERAGRARASRFAMLGEPISGREAGALGIATHVVPEKELGAAAAALVKQLATGPTRSYAATRTLLKAGSSDALVVSHQKSRSTFSRLKMRSDAFASGLMALGLEPGDRVGIWATNCAEWTIAQFATAKASLILVNINPAYRLSELEHVLQ